MSRVRIPSLAPFFSRVFSATSVDLHHLRVGCALKPRCFDFYFPLVPFGADLGFFATPGGKAKRMASALEVRGIDRLCAQKSSSFAIKPFVLRHFRSQLKIAPPVATARRPQRHMLSSSGREYATHHQRRGRIGPDQNVACHGDDLVPVAVREARKDH